MVWLSVVKMFIHFDQWRSQEFDWGWGVYVLTSHCNFKTCVNVPHVNKTVTDFQGYIYRYTPRRYAPGLDRIHERDGRTDGQYSARRHRPRMHSKNYSLCAVIYTFRTSRRTTNRNRVQAERIKRGFAALRRICGFLGLFLY